MDDLFQEIEEFLDDQADAAAMAMDYYANQPALEWYKGRVCPRCQCHLNFDHHPFCSDKSLSDEQVLERVSAQINSSTEEFPGRDCLFLPKAGIIPIPTEFPCPQCGQEMDHYRNIGRQHFGVCLNCKIYFFVGSNLFSGWREETEAEWEANKTYLSQFWYYDVFLPDHSHPDDDIAHI